MSSVRHLVGLATLLALSLGLNITLHTRTTWLRHQLALIQYTNYGPSLSPGDPAPPWQVRSLSGASITIPTSGTPTVFYVFSPSCHWCAKNEKNIVALAMRGRGYRFVGVALRSDGLDQYVGEKHLPFEIVAVPAWDTQYHYGLGATPMTIVTGANGRVDQVWRGAYSDETATTVQAVFGIQLPGLD
jgi:hypothetical protein